MWEAIHLNGLVLCFLCGHIEKFQINMCHRKSLCNGLTEKRAGTGAGKEVCPIQTQTTSLWRNFNGCMRCISFKGLILIQM